MKYFNEIFKKQKIEEALDDNQKQTVDFWTKLHTNKAKELSDHAMKGEHTVFLPLSHHEDLTKKVPEDIHNHLRQNGFEVPSFNEYKAGYATDRHGRITSIGKALNKSKASPELKQKFENDPDRQTSQTSHGDLRVAITHHPHQVAGMSTDRGWTSCMHMYDGCNANYLEKDIKHGTHAAYLVHKDDKNIENPIARIAIKPFTSERGHTILRPEEKTYGTGNSAFEHTVREWTNTHFPMREDSTYHIHGDVYQDSSNATFEAHNPESTEHHKTNATKVLAAESENRRISDHLVDQNSIPHIMTGMEDKKAERAERVARMMSHIGYGHVSHFMDHMTTSEKTELYGKLPSYAKYQVNENHSGDILDRMIKNKYHLPQEFTRFPIKNDSQANKLIDHIGENAYDKYAITGKHESEDTIHRIGTHLDNKLQISRFVDREHVPTKTIDHIIKNHKDFVKDPTIANTILDRGNVTRDQATQIAKITGNADHEVMHRNIKGEDIKPEQMNHKVASYIIHKSRNKDALHKAIDFTNEHGTHHGLPIRAVNGLADVAVEDAKSREFLITSGHTYHSAIEYVPIESQRRIKLKSLTDDFVSKETKLKHARDLMQDSETPHAYKFAAANATKNTEIGPMVANGLERFKRDFGANS